MGVTVLNAIEISGFEKRNGSIELQTNQHFVLTAKQILICTNAFARQLLPELEIEPARGQVLVTSPIPDLRLKGAFHYDEGYYYFRNLGDRVLLGGARNKNFDEEQTIKMSVSEIIQNELERFLHDVILPGQHFSIDYRWSGIMGKGREKMPVISQISDGVFCAVRMGGMGVALAPLVGEMIADKMDH